MVRKKVEYNNQHKCDSKYCAVFGLHRPTNTVGHFTVSKFHNKWFQTPPKTESTDPRQRVPLNDLDYYMQVVGSLLVEKQKTVSHILVSLANFISVNIKCSVDQSLKKALDINYLLLIINLKKLLGNER